VVQDIFKLKLKLNMWGALDVVETEGKSMLNLKRRKNVQTSKLSTATACYSISLGENP
jgi:hypothetical protein